METANRSKAEQAVRDLLSAFHIKEKPGMEETPQRVVKMLEEVWAGEQYTNEDLAKMYGKQFETDTHDLVVVKDIEAFKDSTVVDTVDGEFAGAYVTIFALDKNGDAKEIELTPSLNAEISFLQNNDDGKITEHKIVITQDWKITYSTSWFEGDPIEEYRGRIRPLKADYDNHVFEYSYVFFERLHYSQDMMATSEKINLAGSFRHTSDNLGYLVTPLSGPLTFGAQDTGSVFYEYTYLRDMPQSDSGEEAE